MDMYDAPTDTRDLFGLAPDRQRLVERVKAHFDIPETGVLFFFDSDPYSFEEVYRKLTH